MNRIIKKYGNRKLYDTSESSYISLKRVKELIRDGETVTIIDRQTGDDITSEVLTKAILEDKENSNDAIAPTTLHSIIRWGSDTLDAGLTKFGKSINKVLPVADLEDIRSLQDRIHQLEETVERLQKKLDEESS